jgi:hypothetical protein
MMQRLAEIGVVQRRSGAYYQPTEFGMRVLDQGAPEAAHAQQAGVPTLRDVEDIFGQYWDIAYSEGQSGCGNGEAANTILSKLRALFLAAPAPAADHDKARLDHLEAWLKRSKDRGFAWNSYDFITSKPVREQLDEHAALSTASAVTDTDTDTDKEAK